MSLSWTRVLILLLGCAHMAGAAPLSKSQAILAQAKLEKVQAFMSAGYEMFMSSSITKCKTNSAGFKTECTDKNVHADTCKTFECSGAPQYTSKSTCEAASKTWSAGGTPPRNQCCNDGNLECQNSPSGEWVECCDTCTNPQASGYASQCTAAAYEGASVCGTTQGRCWYCKNNLECRNEGCCTEGTPVVWTENTTATSETACKANNHEWKNGDELKTALVTRGSCSTGPQYALEFEKCTDGTALLAEIEAGKTWAEIEAANKTLYSESLPAIINSGTRAKVVNHANAVMLAELTIPSSVCFAALYEATNEGKVKVTGGAKTDIYMVNPTNLAGTGSGIEVSGGSFKVLGGTSAGPINIATTGKIAVVGVENSGTVAASLSQDVLIANVVNKASGVVTVTGVEATLNDVTNAGKVKVMAGAGKYNAFDITNTGEITIAAGAIEIHTICPSSGTITASAGVTGKITYESGCKGIITVPNTVTLEEIVKKAQTIGGDLDMTVPDADAFIADKAALDAVAEGIANSAGVSKTWVTVTATKKRRLQESSERRLTGTVTITYKIEIPATASSSAVSKAKGKIQAISTAELTKNVQTKVTAAKGASYTITVTTKAAPTSMDTPMDTPGGTVSVAKSTITMPSLVFLSAIFALAP